MKDRRHSFVYRGGEARTCRVPCRAELPPSWLSCLVPVCAVDAQQQIGQRQHHKEHLLNHQKLTDTHTINVRKQRGLALGRMIFFSSIMQEQEMNYYSQANSWFPDLSRPGQMHSSRNFNIWESLVFICLLIIMHSKIIQIQDNNKKKPKGPTGCYYSTSFQVICTFIQKEQR